MIKTKSLEIKICRRNIKDIKNFFKNDDLAINDLVEIPIKLLSENSHFKVLCICDKCGIEKTIMYQKYIKNIKNGGYYSCSSKCSQDKVKSTSKSKYGEEYYTKTKEYSNRSKKTNNEKYNSDFYLTSDVGKNKIEKIINDKYGVKNPFESNEIKEIIKIKNKQKWGNENPSKNEEIKKQISVSNKKSWDNKFKDYYKEKYNLDIISSSKLEYNILCGECNTNFSINRFLLSNRILLKTKLCTNCNPINSSSGKENSLKDFIKEIYPNEIVFNSKKIIPPYELDIYIPELKLAIEFNGLYWHSDIFKDKYYHSNKWKMCKDKEIQLIQIWEDDWTYKTSIVKSILKNNMFLTKYKIGARNCEIKLINNKDAKSFLIENHLKGNYNSKFNLALYFNGEIKSLMTFGKLRKSLGSSISEDNYELIRFCNKKDYSIIGAASKLLKYFIKNFNPGKIITYHDKSLGLNSFYEKIGFELIEETKIDYYYVKSGIRVHRYNFRKDKLISMGFDPNKTELKITKQLEIPRIFGAGNIKYAIILEKESISNI
jgi:hypothetical protein